jgi:hypothetical protein
MIRGKNRTEETFGVDEKEPKLKKGAMPVFGHMSKESPTSTERGYSVNQKTGHPVAASDKQ